MAEIRFDTGLVSYNINGDCEVVFNPTDSNFAQRLFETFEDLDKKQEEYKNTVLAMDDKKEIFAFMRERDKEMREAIDNVFGSPVCESLFRDMNVYAMGDGLPVWANLLLSVIDELDSAYAREQRLTNPRISKYTNKYKKYLK